MASRIEMLKQAGFSDAEIGDWATAERRRMHDAGFTDDEIDAAFGVTRPPQDPPAAYIDRLKQGNAAARIAGAAADYARQYFGDAPLGLPPRETEILRRLGLVGDIVIPAAAPVDAALRSVPAGIAAVGAGLGQAVDEAADAVLGPDAEGRGKGARDFAQLAQIAALLSGAGRGGGVTRVRAPVAGAVGEAAAVLPRAEDFRNAAAAVTGTPSSFRTEQKLLRLWTEHGIRPDEVARDALHDRALAADLAAETDRLPEVYARGATPVEGDRVAAAATAERQPGVTTAADTPASGQANSGQHGPAPAPRVAESREVSMYDPPQVPQRPFKFDYRTAPPAAADGRLLADMEGRPLTALVVAGRRVAGGGDVPASPAELGKALRALPVTLVETDTLPAADPDVAGLYRTQDTQSGPAGEMFVKATLSPEDKALVLKHEFGHAIDHLARRISTQLTPDEIAELRRVYTTMRAGPRKTLARQPEDFGYAPRKIKAELIAEGIRAYLTNPNYFKAVAPRAAARIRAHVNKNRRLRHIIQFNSIAAGLIGAGASQDDAGE